MKSLKKKSFFISLISFVICWAIIGVSVLLLYTIKPQGTYVNNPWNEQDHFNISSTVTLEKDPNKEFVILNLTDIQMKDLHDFFNRDILHKEITELVERTNPDLITLTGDQIMFGESLLSLKALIRWLEDYNIPWAPVFGNHDFEGVTPNYSCDLYENAKNCLFKRGPSNLGCLGNYVINITENGKIFKTLYMLNLATNDAFTTEQLNWFQWNAKGIKEYNNGTQPEAICFFHKPIAQYNDAYRYWARFGYNPAIGFGQKYEGISYTETNFFNIAKQNNVKTILCGHNHASNFCINYQGITLAYALKTGELCYFYGHDDDYLNGGTSITLYATSTIIKHNYVEEAKYHINGSDKV